MDVESQKKQPALEVKVYVLMKFNKSDGRSSIVRVYAKRSDAEVEMTRLYSDPDRLKPWGSILDYWIAEEKVI